MSALWPPERVEQQFRGSYHGWWLDYAGHMRDPSDRPNLDNDPSHPGIEGATIMINTPHMAALRKVFAVTAPILLKAAIALFNVKKTNAQELLWGILDAGRTWPQLQGVNTQELEHATDIAGPTFEYLPDRISIDEEETIGVYLQRKPLLSTLRPRPFYFLQCIPNMCYICMISLSTSLHHTRVPGDTFSSTLLIYTSQAYKTTKLVLQPTPKRPCHMSSIALNFQMQQWSVPSCVARHSTGLQTCSSPTSDPQGTLRCHVCRSM